MSRDIARGRAAPGPAGYTMAEVVLAFAIFGIALAGLCPFVLTELRLTRKLEVRFQGNLSYDRDGSGQYGQQVLPNSQYPAQIYYAVPWKNPRMRSLVGGAAITTDQANAVDDYVAVNPGPVTRTPATIYNYQIIYTDSGDDPQVVVDLNVEAQ
jgi:hypothetical protein